MQARIDEIAEQVSELRDLPLESDLDAELVTSGELGEIAVETAELDDSDRAESDEAEQLLQTLRFLDADTDLIEAQEELLAGGAIAGLYVPEDESLYVSAENADELEPATAVTTAHEITHALQDRRFDLERINEFDATQGDAATAFLAVVEGDAVLTEQAWLGEHLTAEEREAYQQSTAELGGEAAANLEDAPPYLVQSLIFPYQAGPSFLQAVVRARGEGARDEVLEDPPGSTAELLAPQRYLDGFEAEQLRIDDTLGPGWTRGFEGTFGAFELLFALSQSSDAIAGFGDAVRSWDGGQAVGFTGPDGAEAAAVALTFADTEAASTACDGLAGWWQTVTGPPGPSPRGEETTLPAGDGESVLVLRCDGEDVAFGVGPDEQTARQAVGG